MASPTTSASLGHGRPSHGKAHSPHPRQSSAAVYNMFDAKQVQTFKEAFSVRFLTDMLKSSYEYIQVFV